MLRGMCAKRLMYVLKGMCVKGWVCSGEACAINQLYLLSQNKLSTVPNCVYQICYG